MQMEWQDNCYKIYSIFFSGGGILFDIFKYWLSSSKLQHLVKYGGVSRAC